MLPSFWEISGFRVIASAKQGDPINPLALIRFEADARPSSDLFVVTGEKVGPFVVVVKAHPTDQQRTLYGTMQLSYASGQWSGDPKIENPVAELGIPQDAFTNPVLELGSERQRDIIAAIRGSIVANAKAELEADVSALKRAYAAQMSDVTVSQDSQLHDLKAEHAAAVAALEAKYEAEIAGLTKKYNMLVAEAADRLEVEKARQKSEMETLNVEHTATLEAAKDAAENRLRDLTAKRRDLIQNADERLAAEVVKFAASLEGDRVRLQNDHASKTAAIKEEHARKVGSLRARHSEEIAKLETGFEERQKRLEEQINDAGIIAARQNKFIAAMETIKDNDTYIGELTAQKQDNRLKFIRGFAKTLRGNLECKGGKYNYGTPIIFSPKERNVNAMSGQIQYKHKGRSYATYATIALTSAVLDYPIKFSFTIGQWERGDYPKTFQLLYTENGAFRGEESHSTNYSDRLVCKFILSN